MRALLPLLLGLSGCLERTTGEGKELDPRFLEQTVEQGPAAGAVAGPTVKLRGTIESPEDHGVDVDISVLDAAAPGGRAQVGKVALDAPGAFEIEIPAGTSGVTLAVFQDLEADGPTAEDPYASVVFGAVTADQEGLRITLVPGSFQRSATHQDAAPGAPGGSATTALVIAPLEQRGPVGVQPFLDGDGVMVTIRGAVSSVLAAPVDLVVTLGDTAEPAGRLLLAGPGAFELRIPRGAGALRLTAVQDLAGDGLSEGDPWLSRDLEVAEIDVDGVELAIPVPEALIPTGAAPGGTPVEAPPGAPGGGAGAGAAGPGEGDAFPAWQGERITISGTIQWDGEQRVDIDLFKTDASAPGGRTIAGKLKLPGGAFSFTAPKDFGALELEAFVDVNGDGPSAGDPVGRYADNPLMVGTQDLTGVTISITGG